VNFDVARDQIFSVFNKVWNHHVEWTDIPGTAPSKEEVWARAVLRHATGGQATLAGADAQKRYEFTGTAIFQVFSPIGDGLSAGYENAKKVVNAYQSARNPDIWFTNVRIQEVGGSGAFEQINVLVDFSYDDVR
jgi:hypothetical protein